MHINQLKIIGLFLVIYILIIFVSGWMDGLRHEAISLMNATQASSFAQQTSASQQESPYIFGIELISITLIMVSEMKLHWMQKAFSLLKSLMMRIPSAGRWALFAVAAAYIFLGNGINISMAVALLAGISVYAAFKILDSDAKRLVQLVFVFIVMLIFYPFLALSLLYSFHLDSAISLVILFAYWPLLIIGAALFLRNKRIWKLNLVAFLSCVVIGSLGGWVFASPSVAFIMLAIFSVYDFISVFITKHMQFMASKAIGFSMPVAFMFGDEKALEGRISAIGKNTAPPPFPSSVPRPALIGSGDAILPGMVISAFAAGSAGLALWLALGAEAGVVANMLVAGRYGKALPALPLILAGMLGFYFIATAGLL